MIDTETGEYTEKRLALNEAHQFYRYLQGPVLVGMEACGNTLWFERLLVQCDTRCGWEMRVRSVPKALCFQNFQLDLDTNVTSNPITTNALVRLTNNLSCCLSGQIS